jgi:hypothetical protein
MRSLDRFRQEVDPFLSCKTSFYEKCKVLLRTLELKMWLFIIVSMFYEDDQILLQATSKIPPKIKVT